MLSFSVVVNTLNRAASLRQTLAGLAALDHPRFEIVVVNGPSADETEQVLGAYGDTIKRVACAERNLSASRNLGIAAAAGDIVAFIDDDAYPDPAWLDRLAEGYDRAEIAGVGGPTYDHTGYRLQARFVVTDRLGRSAIDPADENGRTEQLCRPFSPRFPTLLGTNSSFRRSLLVAAGGFDEEFDYYLDETDLCVRLIDSGYIIRPVADGYVYHKFLASHLRTAERALRDRYSVLKNRVYFSFKHGSGQLAPDQIRRDLLSFADENRKDYRWQVLRGRLSRADFRQFEQDVSRAFAVGQERAAAKSYRTRPSTWFEENAQPFLPFVGRRPARKLHLAFIASRPLTEEAAEPARAVALELAARGHFVHELAKERRRDTVDLEDGAWVHRVRSLPDEVARIHGHRPLDALHMPQAMAAKIGNIPGVPIVTDRDAPNAADAEQFFLRLAGRAG